MEPVPATPPDCLKAIRQNVSRRAPRACNLKQCEWLESNGVRTDRYNGFTLIELLIVVAIIAILAAIAVPNFLEAQTRAKISRARADLRTEATALETYHIDYNEYPRPFDAFFVSPEGYYTRNNWLEHVPSTLTTPVAYLGAIPLDPFKPITPETRPLLKVVEGRHFFFNAPFGLKCLPGYAEYLNYRRIGGDYAIFSYGPDRIYYNEPPGGTPKTQGQFIDYDATNGTLSRGNIIRSQKNAEIFGVDKYLNVY
jgi:type II secretion system protein G